MSDPGARPDHRPLLAPESVRGVVFDLDGTLVDSYAAITESLNAARRHFDLDDLTERQVRRLVGRGLEALMRDVLGEDRAPRGVEIFRSRYAEVFAAGTRALPHAREVLEWLRGTGRRCSVASNKPARFSAPILAQLGLIGYFDSVQGPDVAGATKPDPAMIRACLSAMGVPATAAIYVGDMVLDVESAAAAGVPVVLVGGGSSDREELVATGEPVLDDLAALPALLQPRSSKPGDFRGARDNGGAGNV